MDTKKDFAASEVPTFKVARVGNDRKKKGAGLSFLRSGGTRGVWSGATGGSGVGGAGGFGAFGSLGAAGGAAGAFGMNFTQAMLAIMLASGLASAAMYFGGFNGGTGDLAVQKKPTVFQGKDVKMEGDTSNLPSSANSIPNSLGYVAGSRDGLTPEERARKAAEAEAAAKKAAEEEAARKAEEERLAGAGVPAVDPNALMAAANKGNDQSWKGNGGASAFSQRFGGLGQFSNHGTSVLSGGPGLSGGVNRGFAGGGGVGKGGGGRLSAMSGSRPSYGGKAGSAKALDNNSKNRALGQAIGANIGGQKGVGAGKAETAASNAGAPFDNNSGAGGTPISGPGIGGGGAPSGGGDVSPNPGGGGGGGGPTGGGDTPLTCTKDEAPSADGKTCEAVETPPVVNATPYQWMYTLAEALLAAIAILSVLALILDKTGVWAWLAQNIRMIMIGLGVVIAGLGVAILSMTGDKIAGGILTITGAGIAVLAYTAQKQLTTQMVKDLLLKEMLASMLGGMAAGMTHKPAAASQ